MIQPNQATALLSVVSAGAASPDELEIMLEDACLLNDASILTSLFDVDAVLLTRGTSQVREGSATADLIIDQLRRRGSYVPASQLAMQAGRLALIISGATPSVARRSPDGWQYMITRLDMSGAVLDGSLRPEVASPSDAPAGDA
jgi:hypothetical protein